MSLLKGYYARSYLESGKFKNMKQENIILKINVKNSGFPLIYF